MYRSTQKIAIAALLTIFTAAAKAQTTNAAVVSDQQAYCQYVTEQATAQRDILISPSAVAGVTQPNTGLPMQSVWGVSSSLSSVRKAGLTMDAARKNCDLYSATTTAQQEIQYALPSLEKQALEHRLDLIQQASQDLDALIANTTKMMDAQNATRPMLFALQTAKIKLDADRSDTQSRIATLYTPALSGTPLKELLAAKQSSEANEQEALDKLARQNNWDVSVSVGAHQQISPFAGGAGAYGEVTVSYNLGSHAINKHLDQAADAYTNWKTVQEGDVARNAEVVRQQVAATISAQETRLKSLQDANQQVAGNLQLIGDPDTTAAMEFRNQLASTQLLLGIESGDAAFRLERLKEFLSSNY
ncbi:MAG TPA: hypothetical protein VN176_18605 [Verrucomicrobiae bacterium]|jgi:hypothetical protein|nr:hypothetical protein [Verrucomicrobiae bacterium]